MKHLRASLVSIFCLIFLFTSLPLTAGCAFNESEKLPPQTGAPLGGAISSAGIDMVLGGLASGVLSWAGGKGCELLFGLIFESEDKTGQDLDEIKDKLDEMDKKLDSIQNTVEAIDKKVDAITAGLQELDWDVAVGNIVDPLATIDATFTKIQLISENAKNNPAKYQDDVADLSKTDGAILSSDTGVVKALGVINSHMLGKDGQQSLLSKRKDQVSKGLNYENEADSYDAFALFFTALLARQVKGVELVANAYAGQDKPEMAVSYLKNFYKYNLVPQVELFSSLVSDMVWENDDMMWSEVILNPAPYIFPSADRLANQLLSSYGVDEAGNLQAGEEKSLIIARIRYSDGTSPLSKIKITDDSSPQNIFTVQPETQTKTETARKVLVYRFEKPSNGTYRLYTADNPDILHDYGEKPIVINDANRYGYIGVYAWAPSTGDYQIINRNSKLIIDTTGKSDRDNIQQWIYYGFDNQLWNFEHVGNGYYKITNKYSDKVLDVLSSSKDDKANVIQYKWNNTPNQRWRLHTLEDGYLVIINENSGKVLDIEGGKTGKGANLQQLQRRDSGNQRWELKPAAKPATDADIYWKFIPQSKPDFRLDVRGGLGQGSVIQAYEKNDTNAQKWLMEWKTESGGDQYYRLTPKCDKKTAASVRGNSKDWGAIIQTWTYEKGQDGQLWKFEPVGKGYYRIVNKNSGMVMEETTTAIHQLKWSDAKDKDTVTWEIIKD